MDERALHTVNQVWAWVGSILAGLAGLPGFARGLVPGPVWARAFSELRRAEALARRALIALSATRPRPVLPRPSAMPPEPSPSPARTPAPRRAALFRLSDPLPDPWASGPLAAIGTPEPGTLHRLDGLKARMAALQTVLADPEAALQRYLHRRDRPRRHIFDRGTAPRLRPGAPPGYRPRPWWDMEMSLLDEIHRLAVSVLNAKRV